jgi:hypothetical protein
MRSSAAALLLCLTASTVGADSSPCAEAQVQLRTIASALELYDVKYGAYPHAEGWMATLKKAGILPESFQTRTAGDTPTLIGLLPKVTSISARWVPMERGELATIRHGSTTGNGKTAGSARGVGRELAQRAATNSLSDGKQRSFRDEVGDGDRVQAPLHQMCPNWYGAP